ncbi:hypothetical protein [Pseudopontixanthobacter vadosimaris]|uniref:hypothetical protein n=1 Tax=Pseudopontixanthobacter vadosimaris TaxID=2726450 RepID=UPI0014728336|nr:hypothetical protein [Pseudopontixanthobacter vadosimaris]
MARMARLDRLLRLVNALNDTAEGLTLDEMAEVIARRSGSAQAPILCRERSWQASASNSNIAAKVRMRRAGAA